jgi:serine/threonine-protein kinase RsbW
MQVERLSGLNPIAADDSETLEIVLPADPESVSKSLRLVAKTGMMLRLTQDYRGTVELVLAEALNNIVEHACDRQCGKIYIRLNLGPQDLHCRIEDNGRPMSDGNLPSGELQLFDPSGDVAEGGFGWFLIRSLSHDLDYRRIGECNQLSFRISAEFPNKHKIAPDPASPQMRGYRPGSTLRHA